jgi:hypothetical protein
VTTVVTKPARWSRETRVMAPRIMAARSHSLFDGGGGGPTLDEYVTGVWEELTAHSVVSCPLCQGPLEPEYAAHAQPIGGRCASCGTALR